MFLIFRFLLLPSLKSKEPNLLPGVQLIQVANPNNPPPFYSILKILRFLIICNPASAKKPPPPKNDRGNRNEQMVVDGRHLCMA